MAAYVEAYETVRDYLLPDGWAGAGGGERYPGDFRGRALLAVRELEAYVARTADFWALEPAPDMGAVLGRYNSLWDALAYQPAEPGPAPESSAGPAPGTGDSPTTFVVGPDIVADSFYEPDEPVAKISAAFEAGEKGVTGAPTPSEDADRRAQTRTPQTKECDDATTELPRLDPSDPATPGPLGVIS